MKLMSGVIPENMLDQNNSVKVSALLRKGECSSVFQKLALAFVRRHRT